MSVLPPAVQALLDPSAYPHPVSDVRLIQTHISYVFLAGDYVYKIKKPVDFGFLDYSTLGKRRYYCRREVVLNSRLCSDTYLGVVPIRESAGRFAIGGPGTIVEYAVRMRRLPAERMMDRLLAEGKVTPAMARAVADKLVPYHATAETSPTIARFGDWAIRYNWQENVDQWTPYIGRTLSPAQDRILRTYGEAFLARRRQLLRRRVDELRIRRVHADLRSDAICFQDGICIFDCVEFSRRINLLDVARDVGFLAMDLEYRGRTDLAQAFVDRYVEVSGDGDLREVLDFYACYSACVRGKVESFLLDQPEVPVAEKRRARAAARRYFGLACSYAQSLPPAMLVITCGLPGTGKSTLARALAEATGSAVVSSDVVRKRLAGIEPTEHRPEEFRGGIYAGDFTDRTYAALLAQAREALDAGRSVILDASFIRREQRRQAQRLASASGAQFACLELAADSDAVRRRLERRLRRGADPSDAGWEVYVAQKRRFQRPAEVPAERRLLVDSQRPIAAQVRSALKALRALSPLSLQAGTSSPSRPEPSGPGLPTPRHDPAIR
ncbi:MAG: AAA family ATPase [Dehalococcoidia bacterium]|nr:AAA family ATPase [Dehalococcoidia bacterium]